MKSSVAAWLVVVGLGIWGCSSSDSNGGSSTGGASNASAGGASNASAGGSSAGGNASTGGSTTASSTIPGVCPDSIAVYCNTVYDITPSSSSPVAPGQMAANSFGLYDMIGNTIEWTQDCYHSSYTSAPTDGSAWEGAAACPENSDGVQKWVARGGCAGLGGADIRVTARAAIDATGYGSCWAGVRCVTTAASPSSSVEWVSIPAGTFTMGCSTGDSECLDDEKPTHSVTVSAFKMMKYEVTQSQYQAVITDYNTTSVATGCASCAEYNIPYASAASYCEKIGGRLPTEAEWEYAARGGTTTRFYCGEGTINSCND